VLAVATVALGLHPPSTEAGTRPAADRLWNRGFVATAIEVDRPMPFSHPGQIEIFFYAEKVVPGRDPVDSPCHHSSLPVHVGRHRIWKSKSEAGWRDEHCPRGPERRSRSLAKFFRSDPRWRLVDGRLSLTTGSSVIRLLPADVLHPG
jgi:hypothetical protein